jgi:hypothetical protein
MTAAKERPTEQVTKRAAIYLRQSSDPSGMQFGVESQYDEILRYIHARDSGAERRPPGHHKDPRPTAALQRKIVGPQLKGATK